MVKKSTFIKSGFWLSSICFMLFAWGHTAFAQNRDVSGKVSDTNGDAVPGASITVKGTNKGTSTGADGTFRLSASDKDVLVISSVGYTKEELTVGSRSIINISLKTDESVLQEIVVTALGISREKKTLVYATQQVKPAELVEARDPNNVINSLAGKVANAVITQGSGGPGSGARIVLRGNRSIQGNNNALIVVDGVPLNNGTNGAPGSDFGGLQGSDGASSINPDDIESVNVLRGASAAALYGNQAGNGVIIITTKKGLKDRVTVDVNSGYQVENVWSLPFFQNQYGQGNGGAISPAGESWGAKMTGQSYTTFLGQQGSYSPQPNNVKDFFRQASSFNNAISVSGGGDKMQTYVSFANNKTEGIIPGNDLNRNTVNLRVTNQVTSKFSTDAKITYVNQDIVNRPRTGEENSPVMNIYNTARNIPTSDNSNFELINNLGIPEPTPFPSTLSSIYQNAYWINQRTSIDEKRDRVIGFLTAKYKITPWLAISGKANLDKTIDKGTNKVHLGTILYSRAGGNYSESSIVRTDTWLDLMLEGENNITNDLKINYRVGGIYNDGKYEETGAQTNGLNITNKFSLAFAQAPSVSSNATQVQTQSVFGQTNLSYKDKIFLDLSLRNDWDSRLASPHTYLYPSAGISTILSEMVNLPSAITFLKASLNYAEVGNGGQFGLLNPVYTYSPGAGNGFLQRGTTLPFPDLLPEIVKNIEFGIESRFLQNRIGFTATVYKSNSFNQLLQISLPVATGYNRQYINAGNIQNSGFELVVDGTPVQTSNFKWNTTLNFSTNRNKVVELGENTKIVYLGGGFGRSGTPVVEEGKSYGDLLAFKWQTNASGQYIVDDKGKPVLTPEQELIGNFMPRGNIGLTNSFEYKNFNFRLLVDARLGGTVVSGTEMNLAFSGIPEVTENFREGGWGLGGVNAAGTNVDAKITAQDFWQIASGKRYGAGEFFAYDATNARVRELSVGYRLPVSNLKFIKMARLSLVGRNLMWLYRGSSIMDIPGIGKRKMWFDPDMGLSNNNFQGVEYGTMPSTRSIGLNLRLTF